jgi:peptide/nickel transport system substrate-binding protein
MIEGEDETDVTSCDTIKPISGFDPNKQLILVRNPDYDPATDDPEARESLPDEFHFLLNSNAKDIYAKVGRSEYEDEVASEPPQILREYSTDDALRPLLKAESGDATWYINFDLTQPPFDDVHVRRAANLVMDKEALVRAWGGPIAGDIATHITPPIVTGGHPTAEEYDPYPSESFRGDLEAAKAEMALSKYDSDGDGLCDDPVCDEVLHLTRSQSPWTDMVPVEEEALEKIGITLETRELADFYTPWQTPTKTAPISSGAGWGKDYADALTYIAALFGSDAIAQTGSTNVWLVGVTPDIAERIGIADLPGHNIDDVPSIDADIEECTELTDQARTDCWIDLDKKLMEDIVPWIPFLWTNTITVVAPSVSQWAFDQSSGYQGWAHVAVDQDKQRGL